MRSRGDIGTADISTGENGEGYSGENGEGYSGIIKALNGFAKCAVERKNETAVLINCEAWVKLEDGSEKKASAIQAGVTLHWQTPTFSLPNVGTILGCNVLSSGLAYQCNAEVADTVVATVAVSLNITDQNNTQAPSTSAVSVAIPQTPPATAAATPVFSAGSGTIGDPYLISTVQDLKEIGKAPNLAVYYKLTNDIDLSGSDFTTIGSTSVLAFKGNFDGNGKTISNYTYSGSVTTPSYTAVGLFGYLKSASIKNLNVTNVGINSGGSTRNVGALAGYVDYYSSITNCTSSGSIVGSGTYQSLGGLVGSNNGTITLSHSSADVSASGSRFNVGGLAGSNNKIISTSYSIGNVTMTSKDNLTFIGGLTGQNNSATARVSDCYSLSVVKDTAVAATNAPIGGLIGSFAANSTLTRSYFAGVVTSNSAVIGALVGIDYTAGSGIQYSYYDTNVSGISGSYSKTTLEMKTLSTFETWDFTTVWNLTPGNYPVLR